MANPQPIVASPEPRPETETGLSAHQGHTILLNNLILLRKRELGIQEWALGLPFLLASKAD
jgi:hypothetical protein